jgi:hypothetical protein
MSAPIADVVGFPRLLWLSAREHRLAGSRAKDFRVLATWKAGPAADSSGPFLISLTQYRPHRLSDLFGIWRAADRLGDELVKLDGAHGVVTYLQPGWGRAGSLSIWTDEAGLTAFVDLPEHRETMRRYRSRGAPLRSAKWWSEPVGLGVAMAEGQHLLDASEDRRVAGSQVPPVR